jgi:HAD superfamily hydrolase (TIGR01484 family)
MFLLKKLDGEKTLLISFLSHFINLLNINELLSFSTGNVLMPQIKLLATDYDDTLVPRVGLVESLAQFREVLQDLKVDCGTRWAIVTGRDFRSLYSELQQFKFKGLRPDYVVVSESYIFRWTKWGYLPDVRWNFKVWLRRRRVRKSVAKHICYWQKEILSRWPSCTALSSSYASLWYSFEDKEDALEAEEFLDAEISDLPQLQIFRTGTEIYMGVTFCGKGDALNELCHRYNFPLGETLAIGDGENDVSMLNGSSAKMVACVGNSCDSLQAVVKEVSGYQAQKDCMNGVVESIMHFGSSF